MAEATLDARKVTSGVTVRVKMIGLRQLKARLWLAERLFHLGALVSGCNVEIEHAVGGPPDDWQIQPPTDIASRIPMPPVKSLC